MTSTAASSESYTCGTQRDDDDNGTEAGSAYIFDLNTCGFALGDMNCDGEINAFDIEPFLDLLFGGGEPCNTCTGAANGAGELDAFDIEPCLNCLFP